MANSIENKNFLKLDKINKCYGKTKILENIDFSIKPKDFLVLVGPSGCGKSTLLNMIAGLEEITEGEIYIDGKCVNGVHPSQRDIAMVFQSYALYPNMSVRKNLSFGLEMHKVEKKEIEKRVSEVAEMLQIGQLLKRKPAQLSGGQRQRVAMGRALVRRPQIFLFDEPLSNLDAKLRVDMRTEIKRLHKDLDATIVYVTHDQIEAMTLSTKIAVLNKGKIQQLGTPDEIYNTPANVFVAQFMGAPTMNILEANLTDSDGKLALEFLTDGTMEKLFLSEKQKIDSGYIGQKVFFGIRPEGIHLVQDGEDTKNSAEAMIDIVEPAGADCFVILSALGQTLTARFNGDFRAENGKKISVRPLMETASIFDIKTEEKIST